MMSRQSVIILTLCSFLGGCSLIESRYGEQCNNRALVGTNLEEFINSRFPLRSPVRMGIIPFSVPANLTASLHYPGLGNDLAWKLHQELAPTGISPILEIFNRQEWPGKKDEFFTGNFGALTQAREAGYDLVIVGQVEPIRETNMLTVDYKVIEVDAGITVVYGRTIVDSIRPSVMKTADSLRLGHRQPSQIPTNALIDKAARCMAHLIRFADE